MRFAKNQRLKRTLWGLVAGLLSLAFAGCAAQPGGEPPRTDSFPLPQEPLVVDTAGRTGGTLNYPLAGEPASFNAANVGDSRTQILTSLLAGTILEFDRKKQQVIGGIMKEWSVAEDATSVTLKLRAGVRFSDGVPVTADDIVFTFDKIYQEGSLNLLRGNLLVKGEPLAAEKIDDRTVRINFPYPYAGAEFILTTIPILPKHKLSEPDRLLESFYGLDAEPEDMVGLGAFVVSEHVPGRRTVLRHNPYYWRVDREGVRLPYLNQVTIHYIRDRSNQVLRFQAGELDLLDTQLRPDDYLQIQKVVDRIQTFNAGPSASLVFCWFNENPGISPASGKPYLSEEKKSWFLDLNFRQAVSHAISREAIVQNVFLGLARPAWSLIPESIPAWHAADLPKYDQDPGLARDLLRRSGFSWRAEGEREQLVDPSGRRVSFTISVRSDDFWTKIAAVMQQDLEKIGMEVGILPEEFGSLVNRIEKSREYDAALLSFEIPYDPVDHSWLLSSSPGHFWNPNQKSPSTDWESRVNDLMHRQMTVIDFTERQRFYHEVQRLIFENAPLIPLVNKDVLVGANKRLHNVKPVTTVPYSLWNVWELWVD